MNQIYVTLQPQKEVLCDNTGKPLQDLNGRYQYKVVSYLGYAAKYDPTKEKCEKKNRQQESWAGLILENGILMKRESYDYTARKYINTHLSPDIQHKILDNVPISGFKIAGFATRYSTANKLFKISDPRGFDLEISVANMVELLHNGTVTNGEILGDYFWDFGKNGIGKAYLKKG